MSQFRFNFDIASEHSTSTLSTPPSASNGSQTIAPAVQVPVVVDSELQSLLTTEDVPVRGHNKSLRKAKVTVNYLKKACPELAAHFEVSDVIPGVYEGGFKLWECSLDLLSFIYDSVGADPNFLVGKTVLDVRSFHTFQ